MSSEKNTAAQQNLGLMPSIVIAVYIILSTLGAASSIINEFVNHSAWHAVGYVITTAVFVIISINIFLLVQSARGTVVVKE